MRDFEFNLVFDDGTVRDLLGYGTPLLDAQGRPAERFTFLVDITARKQAEEARQATLHRFYLMLSSMYCGVLLVTDDGRIEFANQAFCDAFGFSQPPADLNGMSARDVLESIEPAYLHPDQAMERIAEILRLGQAVSGEEIAMQDGRTLMRISSR